MSEAGVLLLVLALGILLSAAGVLWTTVGPGRRRRVPGRDVRAATIQARVRAQRRNDRRRGDMFGGGSGL